MMNYLNLTTHTHTHTHTSKGGKALVNQCFVSNDQQLGCYCCGWEGGLRRSNESYMLSDLGGANL